MPITPDERELYAKYEHDFASTESYGNDFLYEVFDAEGAVVATCKDVKMAAMIAQLLSTHWSNIEKEF